MATGAPSRPPPAIGPERSHIAACAGECDPTTRLEFDSSRVRRIAPAHPPVANASVGIQALFQRGGEAGFFTRSRGTPGGIERGFSQRSALGDPIVGAQSGIE